MQHCSMSHTPLAHSMLAKPGRRLYDCGQMNAGSSDSSFISAVLPFEQLTSGRKKAGMPLPHPGNLVSEAKLFRCVYAYVCSICCCRTCHQRIVCRNNRQPSSTHACRRTHSAPSHRQKGYRTSMLKRKTRCGSAIKKRRRCHAM